jgi:hypothetical protein
LGATEATATTPATAAAAAGPSGVAEQPASASALSPPVRDTLLFPAHVRAALAARPRQSAFGSPPPVGEIRISFLVLPSKPSAHAMHIFKRGTRDLIHGDAAAAAASVQSAVAVRALEAGNPAAPGVGVFARQPIGRYAAICQFG